MVLRPPGDEVANCHRLLVCHIGIGVVGDSRILPYVVHMYCWHDVRAGPEPASDKNALARGDSVKKCGATCDVVWRDVRATTCDRCDAIAGRGPRRAEAMGGERGKPTYM